MAAHRRAEQIYGIREETRHRQILGDELGQVFGPPQAIAGVLVCRKRQGRTHPVHPIGGACPVPVHLWPIAWQAMALRRIQGRVVTRRGEDSDFVALAG